MVLLLNLTSIFPDAPINIRLLLSYDGTDFLGWQQTPFGPTIEGHLREVIEQIVQEKVSLQAASRTDRGVHAEGQVVNFFVHKEVDEFLLKRSINALLPDSIRVWEVKIMPLSFHPTLDAISKEYHYHLFLEELPPKKRHYGWHIPYALDEEAMKKAAAHLMGFHNFSSFRNTRRRGEEVDNHLLILTLAIESSQKEMRIIIRGKRFLYKMVRNIVGTLVEVGRGKILPEKIPEILTDKRRAASGVTAPAHGLTLMEVFYNMAR